MCIITKWVCNKDFGAPLIKKNLFGPLFSFEKDKDWSAWRLKLTTIHIITLFTTTAAEIITRVCSKYLFHSVIYYAFNIGIIDF